MKKEVFSIFANLLGIIGLGLSIFIACRIFPNNDNTGFDYQAVLVGIMGGIFTLLIGWNIYQVVDWKNEIRKIDNLRTELYAELNKIRETDEYNQAIFNALISQNASLWFNPNQKVLFKYLMLAKGLKALKSFAQAPFDEENVNNIMELMIKGLKNSKEFKLADDIKTEFVLACGEIENRNAIKEFDTLVRLIQEA